MDSLLGLGKRHPEDKGELEDVVEGCVEASRSVYVLSTVGITSNVANTYGTSRGQRWRSQ